MLQRHKECRCHCRHRPIWVRVSGDASVTLSWDAVGAATGYRVYRSTTAGSGHVQIADVATAGFTDTAVSNGTTYYYYVTAYDAVEESSASGEVAATPQSETTAGAVQFNCDVR